MKKLVNVPTSLNNFKTKVDDLDVGELKTVPVYLTMKILKLVDSEVIKNTKFNTLQTKVNSLEKTIPDATTLIHIDQYNADKQNLEQKLEMLNKKTDTRCVVIATILNTKISKVENKIPDTSSLVTTTILNTKISDIENKISNHDKYITTPEFNKLTA